MRRQSKFHYDPWPALPYEAFKSTKYLLHRSLQVIGKLKLATPFEPHWANVAFWLTSQGLTTGPICHGAGSFTVEIDLIAHQIILTSSWGNNSKFGLVPMSVAQFTTKLFNALKMLEVPIYDNLIPQEVPDPIPFDLDTEHRHYNRDLANAFFRILVSSHNVLQQYHARFTGRTPQVGFMWGTFDLRDARYRGKPLHLEGADTGYIRRNAMDDAQVEAGWWPGDERYPHPAFFSFIYPEPKGMAEVKLKYDKAKWVPALGEFILDYHEIYTSQHPEKELLAFFESSYEVEAKKAGWKPGLLGSGKPI